MIRLKRSIIKPNAKIWNYWLYLSINNENFQNNHRWICSHYNNKRSLRYYIVQKLIKEGKRIKAFNIIDKSMRLVINYAIYLVKYCYLMTGRLIRKKILRKLKKPFRYKHILVSSYRSKIPSLSIKLVNEFKGKRRTRKKLLKPFYMSRKKARIFELALWLKRLSYIYKYRSFYLRFSLILFNFMFFSETRNSKLRIIRSGLASLKKKRQKIYVQTHSESKAVRYYRGALWELTLSRLKVRILPLFDRYYKRLCLKYYKNPSYIHDHMIKYKSLKRYWVMLVREKKLKWTDIHPSERDRDFFLGE